MYFLIAIHHGVEPEYHGSYQRIDEIEFAATKLAIDLDEAEDVLIWIKMADDGSFIETGGFKGSFDAGLTFAHSIRA